MGVGKLEKGMKKTKKIKRRGRELVDDGGNSGVTNISKCDAQDDATEMNDDIPAVLVKADKSKKIRKSRKRNTSVSNEGRAVNNGEESESIAGEGSNVKKDKTNKALKKKRKRVLVSDEQSAGASDGEAIEPAIDDSIPKKDKSKRARKNKTKDALVSREPHTVVIDREEAKPDAKDSSKAKKGKSKKVHKARKASQSTITAAKSVQEVQEIAEADVYQISSGEDDDSKGMKKWIKKYHEMRPGIKVLQEQIDDFITRYDEQEEQAKREKEEGMAEDGWTVVVHRKGGKKTTDSESGVAVGSVAEAAVRDKMAKKKSTNVGLDFYRFQKREAHRSEIMKLQSKFEEDKKRIQQLRAARKFKPY